MKRIGSWFLLTGPNQRFSECVLILTLTVFFFTTGCTTTEGTGRKSEATPPVAGGQAAEPAIEDQVARLQSREKKLEKQIRSLNAQLRAEKISRDSLISRLETAQAAREDAIREVVRIRARIQGMASQAEASAMFAEARVMLDRMEEEAYNEGALQEFDLARSYIVQGKKALDTGNPGGAAYLFDLIPGLYEGMKKADPRKVKIKVSIASLRNAPAPSAPKIDSLYLGEFATGLDKNKDWVKVKASSGKTGWLMKSQVQ